MAPSPSTPRGWARDQFSLSFDDDANTLRALVQNGRRLEVLVMPRDAFDEKGKQSLDDASILIDDAYQGWVQKVRFTSRDWLLAATQSRQKNVLLAVHVPSQEVFRTQLRPGNVTRLEPMSGVGALVSMSTYERRRGRELELIPVTFEDMAPELGAALRLEGVAEGESRSHGFFFKPTEYGGMFGLPVMGGGHTRGWWGNGIANIAFFGVAPDGAISLTGAVSASADAKGECATSCVDWYGNTRPIFLGDRIFALMGAELAEVQLGKERVSVLGRVAMR